MERKRVRVFRPSGQSGPSMAIYQPGGQIPGADQGGEAEMILKAYMQSQQMNEQEAQQFIQSFMQMQPDQQQAMLSQIAEQLMSQQNSQGGPSVAAMPSETAPMARFGGDINKIKKSLYKKAAGGATNQNVTSDNAVENRAKLIMNSLGEKMIRNTVDKAYEMKMNQMSNAAAPNDMFDLGGSYNYNFGPFYGGYDDPAGNPMIQNFYSMQNKLQNAGQDFMGALGDLAEDSEVTGIKTRAVGPMFENMRKQDEMSMSRFGGSKRFQPGGTYTTDEINMALDDLGVTDEEYHQAIKEGRQDSDAVNRVNTYIEALRRQRNVGNETTTQNLWDNIIKGKGTPQVGQSYDDWWTSDGSTPGFAPDNRIWDGNKWVEQSNSNYTGSIGGFSFKDGVLQYNQPGGQGTQGYPGGFTGGFPAASSMQNLLSTYGAGAIGRAFQMMTPEDVFMNKFKVSSGIMGPRLVAKWKYKPDGSVERVGDFSMYDDTEENVRDAYGNLTTERKAMQSYQDPEYLRQMGRTPEEYQLTDEERGFTNRFGKLVRGFGQPDSEKNTERAIRRGERQMERNARKYRRKTGEYPSADLPFNMFKGEIPEEVANPDMNLFEEKTQPMAIGGRAGKLVMRNKYSPSVGGVGRFASPLMDFGSSMLEAAQTPEDEAAYTPTSWSPVLRGDMPMSRGSWGVGPGQKGQPIADRQPDYSQAYRFPQNPGELNTMQPYFGAYGGTYQYGGSYMDGYDNEDESVYYLDEDEIQDIMKRGGQIEYL